MTTQTDIAIIGAGLSGLALATALRREGRDVILLEARDRPGGRILSQNGYDLGPAWIWPHQRRMLQLIDDLGLRVFSQHSAGRLVFEDARGHVRRDLDFSTMGSALRVAGGLSQITDRLAHDLGDRLRLGQVVTHLTDDRDGAILTGDGLSLRANRVVLALPPRLAASLGVVVSDVPTWMAGYAKLVATYETPFWRSMGLSGDAISHRGPLAEIHDASPVDTVEGALFGFAMTGAARRSHFKDRALAQLGRLFGPDGATPSEVMIKDWSLDPATATSADLNAPQTHPAYQAIDVSARILFAGTETAPTEGGFLEGALEAAEAAHRTLSQVPA
ncbi:MAG: FAD-dependent oxidoreductase [Pseudomonadota bacterium]